MAMTKSQELAILDEAIAELGKDSYLGPWLAQVRGEVEREVKSDHMPAATIPINPIAVQREVDKVRAMVNNLSGECRKVLRMLEDLE